MNLSRIVSRLCLVYAGTRLLISYLDPGSGSLIAQLLIAAVLGIFATLRFWKSRFLRLLGIKPKSEEDEEDEGYTE